MGVLACDRKGCPNIMCNRYSSIYGYICYSCFEELVNSGSLDISAFMSSPVPLPFLNTRSVIEEVFTELEW